MALKVHQCKLDRSKVDLSDRDVARHWSKHFGKSIEEIANAIAKVGENAQTVKKELDCAPTVSLTD
jgi:Protein of unknown function (DUF3606)